MEVRTKAIAAKTLLVTLLAFLLTAIIVSSIEIARGQEPRRELQQLNVSQEYVEIWLRQELKQFDPPTLSPIAEVWAVAENRTLRVADIAEDLKDLPLWLPDYVVLVHKDGNITIIASKTEKVAELTTGQLIVPMNYLDVLSTNRNSAVYQTQQIPSLGWQISQVEKASADTPQVFREHFDLVAAKWPQVAWLKHAKLKRVY